MEHRWGTRRTLDVGIRLYVASTLPSFGRVLDASASGAYVATGAKLPIMTRVHIALGWKGSQRGGRPRIPAYVARADERGIGIEWQEFAPPSVLALINGLDAPLARVRPRISRRAVRTIGQARPAFAYLGSSRSDSTFGTARNPD